ncbi:polymerase [Coccidioides immitis RS]|uniref:Poly [ADP-ribose] polymerase n=2 Tax=Coccidioides immitis TaxID=5501 RepID=A0A0D8JTN5_COCIM|nr:polymerase [Coccidioides immitis RS]KJF60509.1 polymerase [Coccidioides immitis RS]KMP03132.1 poly polymerase 2 ADP-ribosyltransferase 2 [Coccidioides immitis RMSCC 2394]
MPAVFKNKTVVLSGTFPGYKQADLKNLIETNGGTFSAKVTDDCTHLVCTQKEFENNGTKNKQASSITGISIVSSAWLFESVSSKKCKKESEYLWSTLNKTQAAATSAPNGTADATAATNPRRSARNSQAQAQSQTQPQPQSQPQPQHQTKSQAKAPKKNNKRALDSTTGGTITDTAQADTEPPAKKKKETKAETQRKIDIPVDSGFSNRQNYHVYVDPDGLIYDAALNQTNRMNNNNKFYFIQILEPNDMSGQYTTWMRWGRVGEFGQSSFYKDQSLEAAISTFGKKFKDKSGLSWKNRFDSPKAGKYMFLERDYEVESEDEKEEKVKKEDEEEEEVEVKMAECTLSEPIQHVVSLIFNQSYWANAMATLDYDANKLPLGKLSKRTLQKGFELLKDLSDMVNNGQFHGTALEIINNQYFTVIPHALGRGRIPLINNERMIKKEIALLEALTDMEIANEILKGSKKSDAADPIHPLDQQFAGLGLQEMTPLDPEGTEYRQLEDYLIKTHGDTHYIKYNLKYIFRIERKDENDRFLNSPYANIKNSNRRLLWHGSRTTNYGGILSQGLRIAPPEAPVTGYMFGKGVYFADISSKSANYCCHHNSGNTGLLLLCDVELGDPMLELTHSDYHAGDRAKDENKLATLGMGRTVPYGWRDAGSVHEDLAGVLMPDTTEAPRSCDDGQNRSLYYNEYIVYDVAQIRIKYLFCVGMS